jgi:hypothetical protein
MLTIELCPEPVESSLGIYIRISLIQIHVQVTDHPDRHFLRIF